MKPFLPGTDSSHERTSGQVGGESQGWREHGECPQAGRKTIQVQTIGRAVGICLLLTLFFSACSELMPLTRVAPSSRPIPAPALTLPRARYHVLIERDIAYGPLTSERLDLCLPESANGARPGVILVHGGAWVGGDKISLEGNCSLLAQQGLIAATVNYRLGVRSLVHTMWPAQLVDVQLAVRWLRSQAIRLNLDPLRIGAWGSSAGGHLVTFLGSLKTIHPGDQAQLLDNESPAVSWVVDEFGPVDLTEDKDAPLDNDFLTLFGASYKQKPLAYYNASPLFAVNGQSASTLIIQGDHDTIVPPLQSMELLQALQKNSVPVQFVGYNGGHTFSGLTKAQRMTILAQEVNYLVGQEHP